MSRPPRFSYAHAVHHVTLRCNNREFLFTVPSFELFRGIVQEARARFRISLYNYCLMTNHVHLLFKVGDADALSKAMHWISTAFSHRFNKQTGRHGHLWEGRFRSAIIEEDAYFFRAMAYLDLNPVRAKLAVTPLEYRWCGHRALRDGNEAELDFHSLYLNGGRDARARYASYVRLLAEEAERPVVSLATVHFVGSPRFVGRMEKTFGLRGPGARVARTTLAGGGITSDIVLAEPMHGGTTAAK